MEDLCTIVLGVLIALVIFSTNVLLQDTSFLEMSAPIAVIFKITPFIIDYKNK